MIIYAVFRIVDLKEIFMTEVATSERVFVGNLAWKAQEDELADFFSSAGTVTEVNIIREKHNPQRSRGYAFVSFSSTEEAQKAINTLNEKEFMGRTIHLNPATPRTERETV